MRIHARRKKVQQFPTYEPTATLKAELRRIENDEQHVYSDRGCVDEIIHDIRHKGFGIFLELCKRGHL